MDVSKNRGTQNGWFIEKTLLKLMIWGFSHIFGNTHIFEKTIFRKLEGCTFGAAFSYQFAGVSNQQGLLQLINPTTNLSTELLGMTDIFSRKNIRKMRDGIELM